MGKVSKTANLIKTLNPKNPQIISTNSKQDELKKKRKKEKNKTKQKASRKKGRIIILMLKNKDKRENYESSQGKNLYSKRSPIIILASTLRN